MKIVSIAILSLGLAAFGASADNNFVTTLPVKAAGGQSAFTMPRAGWARFGQIALPQVTVRGPGGEHTVKSSAGAAQMYLAPGDYTVDVAGAEVKLVPTLMFCSMSGKFGDDEPVFIPEIKNYSGRSGMFLYNWNYLRLDILEPFNLLVLGSPWHDDLKAWSEEGRRIVRMGPVAEKGAESLARWNQLSVEKGLDGIIPDEFIIPSGRKDASDASLGYARPGRGFDAETLKAIGEWKKAHPDQTFYAWLGVPWNAESADLKPLYDAVAAADGMIAWESYGFSRDCEGELNSRYLSRASGFAKLGGGNLNRFIVCPGTYEFIENNANVDFKVWLDQQLNTVANHPDFAGTGGIGMWIAYYTDPEILRWFSALVKHYGIDGEKTMLSDRYGYKLRPGIVKHAEWESLDAWNPVGAVELVDKKDTGVPDSYYPRSRQNMLRMTRTPGALNSVAQTLGGLEPGKLYALTVLVTNPDTADKVTYGLDVKLENAEIVNSRMRWMNDFIKRDKPVWNAYKIVFRAGDKPVKLILSESDDAAKARPATLLIDSIQVTPYFTEHN